MNLGLGLLGRRRPGLTGERPGPQRRRAGQYRTGYRASAEKTAPADTPGFFHRARGLVFFVAHAVCSMKNETVKGQAIGVPQGAGFTCTTGISCGSVAVALPRFLRLLISGGHLFSLCQVIWQSRQ
ncbi:hypothetical protein D3C75_1162240 [compost metagenome]